ncbi:MAG: hypothetical protein JW772_02145 [Candidatus Diapherotrites archaeon]|nr:hypothetical protein [Candidatus Diapherotrites archaeon]
MKSELLFAVVLAAIAVLIATNISLIGAQNKSNANAEAIKSSLSNARSGLVTMPTIDYVLTVQVAVASLLIGFGAGYFGYALFSKQKEKN